MKVQSPKSKVQTAGGRATVGVLLAGLILLASVVRSPAPIGGGVFIPSGTGPTGPQGAPGGVTNGTYYGGPDGTNNISTSPDSFMGWRTNSPVSGSSNVYIGELRNSSISNMTRGVLLNVQDTRTRGDNTGTFIGYSRGSLNDNGGISNNILLVTNSPHAHLPYLIGSQVIDSPEANIGWLENSLIKNCPNIVAGSLYAVVFSNTFDAVFIGWASNVFGIDAGGSLIGYAKDSYISNSYGCTFGYIANCNIGMSPFVSAPYLSDCVISNSASADLGPLSHVTISHSENIRLGGSPPEGAVFDNCASADIFASNFDPGVADYGPLMHSLVRGNADDDSGAFILGSGFGDDGDRWGMQVANTTGILGVPFMYDRYRLYGDSLGLTNQVMTDNETGTVVFNAGGRNETVYKTDGSTLETLTVTMPTTSTTGQILRYISNGAATGFNFAGGGGAVIVSAEISTLGAHVVIAWQAADAAGNWVRIQ